MGVDVNIMVGGEAGQGVQSAGFIIAKALARYGLSVFADQDYESRVRGGHNFFRIRAVDGEVNAISEEVDILLALDRQSIDLHQKELSSDGILIFDSDKTRNVSASETMHWACRWSGWPWRRPGTSRPPMSWPWVPPCRSLAMTAHC